MSPAVTHVCLVHLGDPRTGIHRYGRAIARGLRDHHDVEVSELDARFDRPSRGQALRCVLAAAWAARRADAVIVQYTPYHLWSGRGTRIAQVALLHLACRRRTVVVLHDVYRTATKGRLPDAETATLAVHLLLAGAVVVHRDEERERLAGLPGVRRIGVIPLVVEPTPAAARGAARAAYGLGRDDFVTAVLGWIHPRKGHALALESLARLPDDVQLWFLGAPAPPDGAALLADLSDLAARQGVTDRLTVTGYLSDAELQCRLGAVDLALCPFSDASSSASLATWLGSRRPVVASDISVMREHAALAPDAISLTPVGSARALAADIDSARRRPAVSARAFDTILEARSPMRIAGRYAEVCRQIGSRRVGRRSAQVSTPVRR